MSESQKSARAPRRSKCAEESLRREMERVGRMTVEERVLAAITMRGRFHWVKPTGD